MSMLSDLLALRAANVAGDGASAATASADAAAQSASEAMSTTPEGYNDMVASLAEEFSASKAYTAGDYVWKDATLYRFKVDHAAGSWNAAHVDEAVLADDVTDLKCALNDYQINEFYPGQISEGFQFNRLEVGTLASNGTVYSATNRVRSIYANLSDSFKYMTLPSANYKVRFYGYTDYTYSESNYIGRTEYQPCGANIVNNWPSTWNYVGYLFSKVDESDMDNTDISYISTNMIRYRKATLDETLSASGRPADAKAVGDAISNSYKDAKKLLDILEFVPGYGIDTSGDTIGTPAPSTSSFAYAKVSCAEGDKFTINGTGGSLYRIFAFADSNGNVLDAAPANITVHDFVVTAPANAAWLIVNDNSESISYAGISNSAQNKAEWKPSAKTALYITDASVESDHVYRLRVSSANVAYLIDAEPGCAYRLTKAATSARLVVGAINKLKGGVAPSVTTGLENVPVGTVYYRKNGGTVAEFVNGDYKYLLVQVATSSATTMPDITIEKIHVDDVKVSVPKFVVPSNVAEYHQLWSDHIVSNGTKFGENSVCYRELLTTVHDLPIYSYFISFDTLRMTSDSSYNYSLENTVNGEIPFGDYCEGTTKRKVCFISGVHGDEKGTPLALFEWIYNLCYNPNYKKYRCYDYYIVPLVNPTGYNANTRNNIDGVNINRDAVTQSSLEAQAVSGFIAEQTVDLFVDFHQAALPWESTSIPYYAFVSQANDTEATIAKQVQQVVFRAGAESDYAINKEMNDSDNPQGSFMWNADSSAETFKNFAHQYSPISCTLETSQRCPYYSGVTDYYNFTALMCNQTFVDYFLKQIFDLIHE